MPPFPQPTLFVRVPRALCCPRWESMRTCQRAVRPMQTAPSALESSQNVQRSARMPKATLNLYLVRCSGLQALRARPPPDMSGPGPLGDNFSNDLPSGAQHCLIGLHCLHVLEQGPPSYRAPICSTHGASPMDEAAQRGACMSRRSAAMRRRKGDLSANPSARLVCCAFLVDRFEVPAPCVASASAPQL